MTPVIRVEHLSKSYRLGQIGTGTFADDLKLWWAKLRGKPNPLQKIGEVDHGNRDSEDLWALKDVSFSVEQGEVLGIIGKNGAGKSTLLKILSRVTAPTAGRVRVKGRIASLLEVGTGFHPDLTGRENIYLNGTILGMKKSEITRKFDEIVDFAEVEKFIDTPVKRYSSGMYVRLAFAVAAHLDPEILIVDEVLAVGDAEFQKKCLGKMGEVAHAGRTVLFVSHNMDAIRNLCLRSLMLKAGQIELDGSSLEVTRSYLGLNDRQTSRELNLKSHAIDLLNIACIGGDGTAGNMFRWDEDFFIQIHYLVYTEIPNMAIGLVVNSESGEPIFTTTSRSSSFPELKQGAGVSCVSIPGCLLAPGEYTVFVNAHSPYDALAAMDHAVQFRIDDIGREVIGRHGNMRWPGVISPKFEWKNEFVEEK